MNITTHKHYIILPCLFFYKNQLDNSMLFIPFFLVPDSFWRLGSTQNSQTWTIYVFSFKIFLLIVLILYICCTSKSNRNDYFDTYDSFHRITISTLQHYTIAPFKVQNYCCNIVSLPVSLISHENIIIFFHLYIAEINFLIFWTFAYFYHISHPHISTTFFRFFSQVSCFWSLRDFQEEKYFLLSNITQAVLIVFNMNPGLQHRLFLPYNNFLDLMGIQ